MPPATPATVVTHVAPATSSVTPTTTTTSSHSMTHSHVNLDPVTGQPLPAGAVKACCHPNAAGVATHSHTAADNTQKTLLAVGATLVLAGLGYGVYRYYQQYQQSQGAARGGSSTSSFSAASSYPVHIVHDEADFDRVLATVAARAATQHRAVYVLVEGAHDPITQISWCPDCAKADPILHEVLNQYKNNIVLIRAPVSKASYKGNPQHPYRLHKELLVQRIPTLYHFKDGKVIGQLIETEMHDLQKVQKFIQEEQLNQ